MNEFTASKSIARERKHTPRDKTRSPIPLRSADAKRSVQNILHWNSYLPVSCVKTMVRMGWDYTT